MAKRWLALVGLAALLTLAAQAATVSEPYNGRYLVLEEPGAVGGGAVRYVDADGRESALAAAPWVPDGHTGQALELKGTGEHIAVDPAQVKNTRLTVAMWLNWQGAPQDAGEGDDGANQVLFSFVKGEDFVAFSPYGVDMGLEQDGGTLRGVYLYGRYNGEHFDAFNPVKETDGDIGYGLPAGEWHHVTLVADGKTLTLYIDGRKWLQTAFARTMLAFAPTAVRIGQAVEEGDPLHARLDDVYIYDKALTDAQVALLAAGENPLDSQATLPPTVKPEMPTAPPGAETEAPTDLPTEPEPTTEPGPVREFLENIPEGALWGIGGMLGTVLILSAVFSVLEIRAKRGGNQDADEE